MRIEAREERIAWFLLVMLLIAAAALYFHGIVGALPYSFRDLDEPGNWDNVQELRTRGHFSSTYAPLRLGEAVLELELMDLISPGGQASHTAQLMILRVSTILFALLLLPVAYQTGRALDSPAAGVATMVFFMAQPDVVELSKIFRVDSSATLLGMACILFSIRAAQGRLRLLVPAFVAGFAAMLAKYTMVLTLMVPSLVLILFGLRRRQLLRAATVTLIMLVVVGAVVIVQFPPPVVRDFLMSFQARQLYEREYVFQFVSLARAWPELLDQVGRVNFWFVVVGLPVVAVGMRSGRLSRTQWLLIGILVLMAASHFLMIGMFVTNRARDRYLSVLGFGLLWGTLWGMLTQRRIVVMVAALVLTVPWWISGWQYGDWVTLPDTRAMMAQWFVENVPQGARIVTERQEYFDRENGYPGAPIYEARIVDSLFADGLETYQNEGVEYLIAHGWNNPRGGYFSDPDREDFLEWAEPVVAIESTDENIGPNLAAFRVPPAQQHVLYLWFGNPLREVDTLFYPISLRGYDLPRTELRVGFELQFVLYWMSVVPVEDDYEVQAWLLDSESDRVVARYAGQPRRGGLPTSQWHGYMQYIRDEHAYALPADLEPGEYDLYIAMADVDSGDHLPVHTVEGEAVRDGSVLLGEIVVAP